MERKLAVPLIEELESLGREDLFRALDEKGALGAVDQVGWPEEFPEKPDCVFRIGRSRTHLAVLFHVTGRDLRAVHLEDNDPVWQDSCCEFFVQDPADGTYYNFEVNCIGTLLGAKGAGRQGRIPRSPQELQRVRRYTTLPRQPQSLSGETVSWSVALVIPLCLIGISPGQEPAALRANFYKCGDKTPHPHYLSWNRVGTPHPDFHQPAWFGTLTF